MAAAAELCPIENLPDSLLLDILTYLDVQELLNSANVNRRFYRLSQDKRFWKQVDCSNMRSLTLLGIRKFLRRPSSIHVISLRWEGFVRRPAIYQSGIGSSARISVRQSATPSILAELAQRCPNLRELHIVHAHLDQVTLRDFPATLEFLGFEGSIVSFDFFGPLSDPNILPNLKGIDLNYCHNLSSHSRHSVSGILSRQSLTILQLKHCFKVSVEDLAAIPTRLSNLVNLNVSELINVDANFILTLAEHARTLKQLDLSFCQSVDTSTISPLARSDVCRLEKLYVIETKITDEALTLFAQYQPQLRYFNVVKTACTDAGVANFSRLTNGQCQIEHKSSQTTIEKIGASFWWIDGRYTEQDPLDGQDAQMEH